MSAPFTPDEITRLSVEIDSQLRELGTSGTGIGRTGSPEKALPEKQRLAIEKATGQDGITFLRKFKRAAEQDVCRPGGVLFEQWQKWKDVANKDILKTFGGVLVGMGLAGNPLQIAAVAIAVYALHVGLKAFCEET